MALISVIRVIRGFSSSGLRFLVPSWFSYFLGIRVVDMQTSRYNPRPATELAAIRTSRKTIR